MVALPAPPLPLLVQGTPVSVGNADAATTRIAVLPPTSKTSCIFLTNKQASENQVGQCYIFPNQISMMSTCLESNAVQGYVILFKWIRVLSKNAHHFFDKCTSSVNKKNQVKQQKF